MNFNPNVKNAAPPLCLDFKDSYKVLEFFLLTEEWGWTLPLVMEEFIEEFFLILTNVYTIRPHYRERNTGEIFKRLNSMFKTVTD